MSEQAKLDGYLDRADALTSLGRWRDAIPFLQKALALDPEHYDALCDITLCYRQVGELDESLKHARKAMKSAPDKYPAYCQLAMTYRESGNLGKALCAAREGYRLAPESALAVQVMTLVMARRKAWGDALKYACEYRRLAPHDVDAYINLAMVYINLKRWREAEESGRHALQIDATSSAALNNLGVALNSQGKYEEALDLFQRAASLDPQDIAAKSNLADIGRLMMNGGSPYVKRDGTPMSAAEREGKDLLLGCTLIFVPTILIIIAVNITETLAGFALVMCALFFFVALPLIMAGLIQTRYRNYQRLPPQAQQLLKMERRSERPWLLGKIKRVEGVTTK
jgi:superkiller protein 3